MSQLLAAGTIIYLSLLLASSSSYLQLWAYCWWWKLLVLSCMLCVFTGWNSRTSFTKETVTSSLHFHLHCLMMKMNDTLDWINSYRPKIIQLCVHSFGICAYFFNLNIMEEVDRDVSCRGHWRKLFKHASIDPFPFQWWFIYYWEGISSFPY